MKVLIKISNQKYIPISLSCINFPLTLRKSETKHAHFPVLLTNADKNSMANGQLLSYQALTGIYNN